ncbi:hypothetical protein Vretifemale_14098 [Volvox reticuliferus]|uniref:Nuclear envelope membrane protein n=1 Tax=Volvox reticuliferus TaxID=1737510 RepID=A0A8J4FQ94_9CHLO|nr:hypothetical protein Vretifemale_14098 [Volvox reticuliferus]
MYFFMAKKLLLCLVLNATQLKGPVKITCCSYVACSKDVGCHVHLIGTLSLFYMNTNVRLQLACRLLIVRPQPCLFVLYFPLVSAHRVFLYSIIRVLIFKSLMIAFDVWHSSWLAVGGQRKLGVFSFGSVTGINMFVRHPIYSFVLIFFFCTPVMSAGRLLFASCALAFVLWSLPLEEGTLQAQLGEPYARYRKAVPALIPSLMPYVDKQKAAAVVTRGAKKDDGSKAE